MFEIRVNRDSVVAETRLARSPPVFVRSAGDGADDDNRAQPSFLGQNPKSSIARRWNHPMTEQTHDGRIRSLSG